MGSGQSTLQKNKYTFVRETDNGVIATKEGDEFVIKVIQRSKISHEEFIKEVEILRGINHLHIVSCKDYFQDEEGEHMVIDHCLGGNLAQKITQQSESGQKFEEEQILTWIVQICMALKYIHDQGLLHERLVPQNVLVTEFGTICLGEFGKLGENTKTKSSPLEQQSMCYLDPQTLQGVKYDAKSDIWSVGCILYELCMLKLAFSAETTVKLIPKILGGPYPSLPHSFSPELCLLLDDIFNRDPDLRPTASEILGRPFMISFLSKKTKATVKALQKNLNNLRTVADGLERVHQGATIGSLTGGVIGAVGGITSIVGLILTPFTLGASLIVTGVGIGVAVAGGATAGASNITNMVNEASDRKAIRCIIKEFSEKMNVVVTSLQHISEGLDMLNERFNSADAEGSGLSGENLVQLGTRASRGLGGITELVRLVQVARIGRVAAQTARAVRVAEAVTGILSGLFVAVDIFFIAMDAKEIHHIRQARAEEGGERSANEVTEQREPDPKSQKGTECKTSPLEPKSAPKARHSRSEIMNFVITVRQSADQLQKVLDEMKIITSHLPPLED